MKPISCIKNGFLIDKRAAGLSHSERLRLEEHVSTCDACSRDAETLATISDLISTVESPITPIDRSRAIRRALDLPYASSVRPIKRRFVAAFACAALPAAAAAAWILLSQPEEAVKPVAVIQPNRLFHPEEAAKPVVAVQPNRLFHPEEAAKPVVAVQPNRVETDADKVLSGEVLAEDQIIRAGGALNQHAFFESRKRSRIRLGRATVELRANTRIKWLRNDSTIELVTGSILSDIERSTDGRFRVVTEQFMVEVLGTRFEVDRGSVKVHRGAVQILARDGKVVLASLNAPERWEFQPAIAVEREAAVPKRPMVVVERTEPKASCGTLLRRARSQLADDNLEEAAAIIRTALTRSPTRSDRAEARSLQAECALVRGDLVTATATYREVAARFKGLPAAENALFAAARIENTRGDKAEAIVLFERYLREYPNGRFRKEVVRRLKALGQL